MIVEPTGGSGSCMSTGCVSALNLRCPAELRSGEGTACKSACEAFGTPEYCCSGAFGSPATCKPSIYSAIFKSACPRSYSYAYDDATRTFTCGGVDYSITFCPSSSSGKSASDAVPATPSSTDAPPTTPSTSASSGYPPPQEAVPTGVGPSWLPNFVNGDSHGYVNDLKSTVGYVFYIGNTTFTWISKRQSIMTLSTCKSKYVTISKCVCHIIWYTS